MKALLTAILLAGCAAPPANTQAPPQPFVPYYVTPYQAPPPYQMPTSRPPNPQLNCVTTSRPALGGPVTETTCR